MRETVSRRGKEHAVKQQFISKISAIGTAAATAKSSVFLASVLMVSLLMISLGGTTASANEASWAELKGLIFKERAIEAAHGEIVIDAPYRASDDRRVPVTIRAKLQDGHTIKKITFIIDENPMPVSAIFDMKTRRNDATFSTFMRMNGPSTLRAVVESDDGKLFMITKFVKTSGLGACAAPPVGDPDQLQPKLADGETRKATRIKRAAHLKIKHPNLTGLQMDQITLQYILARFVKKVEVAQGDEPLFTLTGSISFSENPELTFDYNYNGAEKISVKMIDTDKAEFSKDFPIGIGS